MFDRDGETNREQVKITTTTKTKKEQQIKSNVKYSKYTQVLKKMILLLNCPSHVCIPNKKNVDVARLGLPVCDIIKHEHNYIHKPRTHFSFFLFNLVQLKSSSLIINY